MLEGIPYGTHTDTQRPQNTTGAITPSDYEGCPSSFMSILTARPKENTESNNGQTDTQQFIDV